MSSDRQAPKWVVDKPARLVSLENLGFTGGKSARVTCKEEKGSANAAATARTKSWEKGRAGGVSRVGMKVIWKEFLR